MHKVTIVGVGTLQTGKFDADKAEFVNPVKAAIKWDLNVDLAEVAIYNNCGVGTKAKAVLLTEEEYEALISGKSWIMPEQIFQSVKTAITVLKDLIDNAETNS